MKLGSRSRGAVVWTALTVLVGLLLAAPPAAAEEKAWVRGEVRLNLRTGPGPQYRILGSVVTGDALSVIGRQEDWTQVRDSDGKEGWIPAGYLDTEPPPAVRLASLEEEVAKLRERLSTTDSELSTLHERNTALESADSEQRATIERLTRDNIELRAGARWPEWITGALILSTGMVLGALLRSLSGRGRRPRIRL